MLELSKKKKKLIFKYREYCFIQMGLQGYNEYPRHNPIVVMLTVKLELGLFEQAQISVANHEAGDDSEAPSLAPSLVLPPQIKSSFSCSQSRRKCWLGSLRSVSSRSAKHHLRYFSNLLPASFFSVSSISTLVSFLYFRRRLVASQQP